MSTFIMIDATDFSLNCPHCGEELEEIRIRRIFSEEQECPGCYENYQLTITLETA